MRRSSFWMIGIVLVLALAVGCSPTAAPTTAPTAKPSATTQATAAPTAASPTVAPTAAPTAMTGKFTAAGSTSLQPLAETLSEAYMAANMGVEITIQGGGSGVGVKSAQDGTAELGMVSRDLTDAEKPGLMVYTVARDAVVVIVNQDVSVDGLTKAQVRDIFSGTITNWSEVGGPDKPITVVAREEGSGTRTAFEDMVMGKEAVIVANAILQSSNGAILNTVASTPDSISFLSLGYVDKTVKVLSIDGAEANEVNASSGKYPIVRPLSFISKGDATGAVKAFLDWALGPDGQKIVADQGYIPVK
ncbi:MAG: phosphate ABC transporter substrate-binding protein [Chloroflexi bacterium]|nr:phosphate ABC transporter substrate-binding protein [Chloroflexota bacterium]